MPDDLDDILESPEHTLLATDLGNTEGPLWHPEGYLTFVDLVGNRLQRWDQTSGVSVVREDTGEGNGCILFNRPVSTTIWTDDSLVIETSNRCFVFSMTQEE